jgi:transcriptional regulator
MELLIAPWGGRSLSWYDEGMYNPSSFKVTDTAAIHADMRRYSFAMLVTQSAGGMVATHLPILLSDDGSRLLGHMARANPQWKDVQGEALVIFSGPHAYVSAAWYETPGTVPTWNYVAVHAYGQFKPVEDRDRVHEILKRTVAVYEGGKPAPWSYESADPVFDRMLREIVGFEIEISRLEGKHKLNQNHPEDRRRKVVAALEARADADSVAIAKLMVESLSQVGT